MTTIRAFIANHPVLTYFALVFAMSWTGALVVFGPRVFLGTKEISVVGQGPFAYLAFLAGPSVAGILSAGLVHGRTGLATFDVVSFFEELGWTGFAIPELGKRYSILTTGLIVGLLWGAWHFPLFSGRSASSSGVIPPALYLAVLLFSWLPPYRVLMVWVYDHTKSLVVLMLMHVPIDVGGLVLISPAMSGVPVATFDLVFAAALWVVAAALAVANRGQLLRQPLQRQLA